MVSLKMGLPEDGLSETEQKAREEIASAFFNIEQVSWPVAMAGSFPQRRNDLDAALWPTLSMMTEYHYWMIFC